jgi:hypothetical protein
MLYDPKWEAPAEIKLEPWQQLLKDAVKAIEERGWTQGMLENSVGNVCSMGAIQIAIYGATVRATMRRNFRLYSRDAVDKAVAALSTAIGAEGHRIVSWNDSPIRTAEEVIEAFNKAIETKVLEPTSPATIVAPA